MTATPNKSNQKLPDSPKLQPDVNNPDPVPPPRGNRESDHNKHNDPGQARHKPQEHTPAEEKQD